MSYSAPQSPAVHGKDADSNASPSRPSKLLRLLHLSTERASSLPPRRLDSPTKNAPQIRPRLQQYHTFDHAVSLFKSSKNIVVLTGAGISTSLGVPDFRSQNGVYNLLTDSIYDDPQELFHIANFKTDPGEFFKQAAKVFPRMQGLVPVSGNKKSTNLADVPLVPKYSATHAFLAMLQSKGKLLTNYTQNIDGLEVAAGLPLSKVIQCHGTLATATCMTCGKRTTARKYMPHVRAGKIPFCKCSLDPVVKDPKQRGRSGKKKRKRDDYEDTDEEDAESQVPFPKGLMKPDMTFFGEPISQAYAPRLEDDTTKVDLLVIIGTSLKVEPVNDMPLVIPPQVPQIWISKDRCTRDGVKVDIELLGECDLILEEIARRAGWFTVLQERLWENRKTDDTNIPSAAKAKENLELRPKQDKAIEQAALPATNGVVIKTDNKVPDQAVSPEEKHAAMTESKKPASYNGQANPAKSEASVDENKLWPSKVTIELEAGQRSRWFVRRAK
ncbi:NAD-dependent histone deacetylase sir2 [Elasticomyces elasticus]|uniref:NAD-dependent histone deacetylase sir2 n=1 Tax=Exophiala sideris TaxID=1016849 RepID=A0ABR0JK16_9EURO|nr:NAD-dependent histone deacetylase sir2 [Elasticomyces elasticus]KAK5035215.1 NAD-dependent histone deacetylase sir2 [Exophiala sideris]KAK5039433.1 NAD-dependent histone deacetylase sir2 [Exophiala sideris]KAK5066139.1 NAD-dependent histone deacetylase sir2 [Exophiala sideris]KAK5186816.1 NAD-dependent histone deacetylase sir2 [Eurotiomycetes sp. CCFEE 6388]